MITKSISMDAELWQEIKKAVKKRGWSISFLARELFKAWLSGKVSITTE